MARIKTSVEQIKSKSLGLSLQDSQYQQMALFIDLLVKWNAVYNLTAIKDFDRIISHHLADSLSVVPYLNPFCRLLDVGSGAGLPGIPLAIVLPEATLYLLDFNKKKTTFLRQCVIELSLDNVNVITARADEFVTSQPFDCIISRALTSLDNLVHWTSHLLAPQGYWLAMKGAYPAEEISALKSLAHIDSVISLDVPGIEEKRHLVKILPKDSNAT